MERRGGGGRAERGSKGVGNSRPRQTSKTVNCCFDVEDNCRWHQLLLPPSSSSSSSSAFFFFFFLLFLSGCDWPVKIAAVIVSAFQRHLARNCFYEGKEEEKVEEEVEEGNCSTFKLVILKCIVQWIHSTGSVVHPVTSAGILGISPRFPHRDPSMSLRIHQGSIRILQDPSYPARNSSKMAEESSEDSCRRPCKMLRR